ncbi:MAG: recombinase family protein [Anaerolineae bacterium]
MMPTVSHSLAPGDLVFGYIRVSGEIQVERGLPVAGQRRAIEEYASAKQLNLTRFFVDEARPGSSDKRAAFQEMMSLALKDPPACKAVLLWEWSRFARDQDDAHFWKASLRRHGVRIIDVSGETPDVDGFEYVVESLIHWKDEQRLHEISASSRRGQQTLARLGYVPSGSSPPRGYMVEFVERELEGKPRRLRRWVPDPDVWNAVKRAWRLRLEGASYETIWRECGLYKRPEVYNTFFTNEIYKGVLRFGGTIISVPGVVTPEEWAQVNENRQQRANGSYARRLNSPGILSGLATCALCGSKLQYERGSSGVRADGYTRSPWLFYHCINARNHKCTLPRIGARQVEAAIISELLDKVLTAENIQTIWADLQATVQVDHAEMKEKADELRVRLAEVKRQLQRLVDAIEQVGISQTISERLHEQEANKTTLEKELARLETRLNLPPVPGSQNVEKMRSGIIASFEKGQAKQLRELLGQLLISVEIGVDDVRLEYRYPFVSTVVCPVPQREFESRSQP